MQPETKLDAGVPASSSSSSSASARDSPVSPRKISTTFVNLEKPVSPRLSPQPAPQLVETEPVELGIPPANVSTATESDANPLTRTRKDDTGNELSDVGEEHGMNLSKY